MNFGARALSDPKRFVGRLQNELLVPSKGPARIVRAVYTRVVPNRVTPGHEDRILFVYDTLPNAVTYDFIHYIWYADWLRRKEGKTHVDVLLVTRKNVEASREADYVQAIGNDNLNWRLAQIIVPICRLFASVGNLYVLGAEDAYELVKSYRHVYPEGYGYENPITAEIRLNAPEYVFHPTITISNTARDIIATYFPTSDTRKLVTLTLRTYGYLAKRNSNIPAWVAFAKGLDPKKYRVVFIPDSSTDGIATIPALAGCEVFDAACWNLELRAALYRRAWMNYGVAAGPIAGLSGLMEEVLTPMIYDYDSYPADYQADLQSNTGLVPGTPPPFYSPLCTYHHGKDDLETLNRVFAEYVD